MKLSDNVDLEISIKEKGNGKADVGISKLQVTCSKCKADISENKVTLMNKENTHTAMWIFPCKNPNCDGVEQITVQDVYDVLTAENNKRHIRE